MIFKKYYIFLFALFSVFPLYSQSMEIYYTSSLNGNLDGCDCKAVPRAGMVRTAAFIRQRSPAALFFDLGDSFDIYPDENLHRAIQSSYLSLELDCSALGDQEFIEGVDWLKNTIYPYLANNIIIDGKEFSARFKTFTLEGFKISVGSLIDPDVFYFSPEKIRKRLVIADPLATGRFLLQEMEKEGGHLKILLFHGSFEKARNLMEYLPGWDVVLVGHEQRLEAQILNNNRFMGSPGDNGNRVGVLKITFQEGRIVSLENNFYYFSYGNDPKDPYVDSLLEEYRRSMIERLR